MGEKTKGRGPRKWAELKFSVIGPLLTGPPEPGELGSALKRLAAQRWKHPTTGQMVRFSTSTIERWYYAARGSDDPVTALMPKVRADAGTNKALSAELLTALGRQYAAHPGWSYTLHWNNLEALAEQSPQLGTAPSYSTVRRRMVEKAFFSTASPVMGRALIRAWCSQVQASSIW